MRTICLLTAVLLISFQSSKSIHLLPSVSYLQNSKFIFFRAGKSFLSSFPLSFMFWNEWTIESSLPVQAYLPRYTILFVFDMHEDIVWAERVTSRAFSRYTQPIFQSTSHHLRLFEIICYTLSWLSKLCLPNTIRPAGKLSLSIMLRTKDELARVFREVKALSHHVRDLLGINSTLSFEAL